MVLLSFPSELPSTTSASGECVSEWSSRGKKQGTEEPTPTPFPNPKSTPLLHCKSIHLDSEIGRKEFEEALLPSLVFYRHELEKKKKIGRELSEFGSQVR